MSVKPEKVLEPGVGSLWPYLSAANRADEINWEQVGGEYFFLSLFSLCDCGCNFPLPVSLTILTYVLREFTTHPLSCTEHRGAPFGPKNNNKNVDLMFKIIMW